MLAGDKGEANLGLEHAIWQRLAHTVDPAALVNHVLPYSQLFAPNVVGTAELIRIALTTRNKPYVYVSTIGEPRRSCDLAALSAFEVPTSERLSLSLRGGHFGGHSQAAETQASAHPPAQRASVERSAYPIQVLP